MIYIIQKENKFRIGMDVRYRKPLRKRHPIFNVWYSPCGGENFSGILSLARILSEEHACSTVEWIKFMYKNQNEHGIFLRLYGNDIEILGTLITICEEKDGKIVKRRVL